MFDRPGFTILVDRYCGQEMLFNGLSLESLMTERLAVIEPVKPPPAAECRYRDPAEQFCSGGCCQTS